MKQEAEWEKFMATRGDSLALEYLRQRRWQGDDIDGPRSARSRCTPTTTAAQLIDVRLLGGVAGERYAD